MTMRYMVTKEEMGYIMEDWDAEWKIPTTETEKSKTKEVRYDEEYEG
jgi:hypothetical protein